MDLIGQVVTQAIEQLAPPLPLPAARPTSEIPQVRGLPVVGNALSMATGLFGFMLKHYRDFGPIFRVRALHNRFIVLAGPEANLFMRRAGGAHLRGHEAWQDFNRQVGVLRMVMSMDGPDHARLRKAMLPGLSRRLIEHRIAEAVHIIRRDIDEWPQNTPIRGYVTLRRSIFEQLGRLTVNVSTREYLDDVLIFFDTLLFSSAAQLWPGLMMRRPRVRRARRRLDALYREIMAAHTPEKRRDTSADFIDDMLALHQSNSQFLAETDLWFTVLSPLFAALHTVPSTCSFMLYNVLKHPALLERMTAEADELFSNGTPTVAGLRQLDVTHRVAFETLRLYPAAQTLFPRLVSNSFEFEGYTVPAGEMVLIAPTVSHHMPQYFPDPDRFDIDRYLPERAEHQQPGVYAPFGVGAHRCVGAGFADVQMLLTLATIIHEAELTLDPPDYELEIKQAVAPHPGDSFKFRVVRRRT